jgi:cyclic beta-1,2-glucan synthetase
MTLDLESKPAAAELERWRERGAGLAKSVQSIRPQGRRLRRTDRNRQIQTVVARAAREPKSENAACILDSVRLIRGAEKVTRDFPSDLHRYPAATDDSGRETPRVCLVAHEYLKHAGNQFSEPTLIAFLNGYQDAAGLEIREIWGLKPALQLALIDRLASGPAPEWPALVMSLRHLAETSWRDLVESASHTHGVLERDPAGAYARMDFASRDLYRTAIGKLARHSRLSETEIAETALAMSLAAQAASDGSRASARQTHVGYYLVDAGLPQLETAIGYRAPLGRRITRMVEARPAVFYLTSIELLTFLIVVGLLAGVGTLTPIFAALLLLLLPASQASVDFVNNLVTFLLPPRVLPKLDFSEGIPENCVTLVAVPSLLLSETQVHSLALDLEIRYLANRDPHLHFALLTDLPDSDERVDDRNRLVEVCSRLIEGMNRRYRRDGRSPFFLLHRDRAYNQVEDRWMGWERKRGKLLDLNRLLRGTFDAFPVKVGDTPLLAGVRYVITLDSDTQLPRGSAAQLVGALAHPLNQAVVDPASRIVVEGYGILQPRIGISIHSSSRSRLAALCSGQTGFDVYTRAVSDVYQDLFGEGIYTGKGIYEVDAFNETLESRFPENVLLSHDLIEGAYVRAALVSDIELIDDYPSHFSAYSRRKHRWVRGDWQIMRWLRRRVPDFYGNSIPNPISLISQWKILDNLRRSLLEPALLILLVGSWFYLPGPPRYWTGATIAMFFIPAWSGVFFAAFRAPHGRRALVAWARDTLDNFAQGNAVAVMNLAFLLHQALLSLDAIVRSVARILFTGRRLLEWETAAESEAAAGPKSTVDVYLEWTPWIALALAAAIWRVRPSVLPVAAPVLAMWIASRAFSGWLNRRPRSGRCELGIEDQQLLETAGESICRFFRDWSSPATNWLIPDNVREDGAAEMRLSPTNLGLLLDARIAAVRLGMMPLAEFVFETRQTLDRAALLEKFRGHLFNWYDVTTLAPLPPRFVSTVDSGNLAAALWTLKQAALAFAAEPPATRGLTIDLGAELARIAATAHDLVRDMDFGFLYHERKKALSVGFNATTGRAEVSCYDLLASEARIACFVAIAKGDIPQEAWFSLGRGHTLSRGERVLISWTGTMFEYLMPALWMRTYPGTIAERSLSAAVRVQREYARRKGVPWGISESACLSPGGEYGYAPFGIPELALKRMDEEKLVISPYSTFLAALMDPTAAVENLRRLEEFGWSGRYGFYEAVDYSRAGGEPIRMWMAHHQGMSLLAIAALLADNPIQEYFHAEPLVRATELLLHERVPAASLAEPDSEPLPAIAQEAAG